MIAGRLNLRRLGGERRLAIEQRARAVERLRWEQLDAMERYAEAQTCRRELLLRYFGDRRRPGPSGRCCDVHEPPTDAPRRGPRLEPDELVDAVVEIARTAEPSVGRAGLDGIARGLDAYRDRYGEHALFGVASGLRPPQVRAAIGAAVARDRLASTEGRYPLLLPPGARPRRGSAGEPGRTRRAPRPAPAADTDLRPARAAARLATAPRPRTAAFRRTSSRTTARSRTSRRGGRRHPPACSSAAVSAARSSSGTGAASSRWSPRARRPAPADGRRRCPRVLSRGPGAPHGAFLALTRRVADDPAGIDRRPASCRRRAIARREHERCRTVTADAEDSRAARSVSAPLGGSAPRVPVPDARGAGDDPLATALDGRIAAARHLAGPRRSARRRSQAGLMRRGHEGGVACGCTATRPPRAQGQGAAHASTLSP